MTALNMTVPDSSLSVLRRSPTEFVRDMKLAAAMHWYSQGRCHRNGRRSWRD